MLTFDLQDIENRFNTIHDATPALDIDPRLSKPLIDTYPPPSYDEAIDDLPPEYSEAAPLAQRKVPAGDVDFKITGSKENSHRPIDFDTPAGIREHKGGKKKKGGGGGGGAGKSNPPPPANDPPPPPEDSNENPDEGAGDGAGDGNGDDGNNGGDGGDGGDDDWNAWGTATTSKKKKQKEKEEEERKAQEEADQKAGDLSWADEAENDDSWADAMTAGKTKKKDKVCLLTVWIEFH